MSDFFAALVSFLTISLKWLLDGALYVLKAGLYFAFDGIFTIVLAIVNALDFSSVAFQVLGNWGAIPPQALYLINVLCISQVISSMVYAIIVRMIINLLPSWITRV